MSTILEDILVVFSLKQYIYVWITSTILEYILVVFSLK